MALRSTKLSDESHVGGTNLRCQNNLRLKLNHGYGAKILTFWVKRSLNSASTPIICLESLCNYGTLV